MGIVDETWCAQSRAHYLMHDFILHTGNTYKAHRHRRGCRLRQLLQASSSCKRKHFPDVSRSQRHCSLLGSVCASHLLESFKALSSSNFYSFFLFLNSFQVCSNHAFSIVALLLGRVSVFWISLATMLVRYLLPWIFALALSLLRDFDDTVSSGNYLIHLCNYGQPNSEASKLQLLLPQVYDGLQLVIADLQQETASLHGYTTFFKDDASKAIVLQVYQQMAAGTSVAVGRNHNVIRQPTFICANDAPRTDLLYQTCLRYPETAVLVLTNTEALALCPFFWAIQREAILPNCPLVIANTLAPNDDRLVANQEAVLVHNLVHFYHEVSETSVLRITDVSELNVSESLLNPWNYAFYYAGRHSISSIV